MSASYRFRVEGRVQGVGFRWSAVGEARRLGITGWVRNRDDGAVEGEVQGDPAALEAFRHWLERGPPAARVDAVRWSPGPVAAVADFSAR